MSNFTVGMGSLLHPSNDDTAARRPRTKKATRCWSYLCCKPTGPLNGYSLD